jgi:hypothetical protein
LYELRKSDTSIARLQGGDDTEDGPLLEGEEDDDDDKHP